MRNSDVMSCRECKQYISQLEDGVIQSAKFYSLFGQVSYNILCDLAIIPRKQQTGSLAASM